MFYKTRFRQIPGDNTSRMVNIEFRADNTGGRIKISIAGKPFTDIATDDSVTATHGNYLTWDDYTKAPLSAEEIYNRFSKLCQKWIRDKRSHLEEILQFNG